MLKFSNAQILKCSNFQVLKFPNAQMLKFSNAHGGWRTLPGEQLRRPGLFFGRRLNQQLARASTDDIVEYFIFGQDSQNICWIFHIWLRRSNSSQQGQHLQVFIHSSNLTGGSTDDNSYLLDILYLAKTLKSSQQGQHLQASISSSNLAGGNI